MNKAAKSWSKRIRATAATMGRRLREVRMVIGGLSSPNHPLLVHLIPVRRCNLACTYCNEFDDFSQPIAIEELLRRVDHLAFLGARIITLSGGEPTLHPQLDELISHIRGHGMIAGLITNGYLLTPERIERFNRARLDHLQISIDNVQPDEISKKSLKVLDKKLQWLAEHAEFHVNINSVLGSGTKNPEDAATIARRAVELGLASTVGIIHDGSGQLRPLSEPERLIFDQVRHLGKSSFGRINQYNPFQEKLAAGKPNNWWRCRAGARYLYICEDGLVHYCSQQRGYPGKPLDQYTYEDIRREYLTEKSCAPYCTVSCVHYVSYFDFWRGEQTYKREMPDEVAHPLVKITGAGE
jgi:MoaA/NifB/PqqE/SkfB family radical SAM enzyme